MIMKLPMTLTLTGKPHMMGGLHSEKHFDPFMVVANNSPTRISISLHNTAEPASKDSYSIGHMHIFFT